MNKKQRKELKHKKEEELRLMELYPIEYEGKLWWYDDCDGVFSMMYHHPEQLNKYLKGIMITSDVYIYPDGKIESF